MSLLCCIVLLLSKCIINRGLKQIALRKDRDLFSKISCVCVCVCMSLYIFIQRKYAFLIRLIPQGTVDNNLGPDRLVGIKALDPNYCKQPTL